MKLKGIKNHLRGSDFGKFAIKLLKHTPILLVFNVFWFSEPMVMKKICSFYAMSIDLKNFSNSFTSQNFRKMKLEPQYRKNKIANQLLSFSFFQEL